MKPKAFNRLILGLVGYCLTIVLTPANAQPKKLDNWTVVSNLNAVIFESPQSENYPSEVLESKLLDRYSAFCDDPRSQKSNGFRQAFDYYHGASLCSDKGAQNYKATSTWFKIVGWIHMAHWQYYLPVVNHDLACVIKKMALTENPPDKLCLDIINFATFADQSSLKLNHLMNVLEILEWQQDHIEKSGLKNTDNQNENAAP